MTDYKNTLNLPQTDFPMKANLANREPEVLKKWEDLHLYEKLCEKNKDKEKFILHIGPPYANGNIHMGTALNSSLKDFVVKSKILSGYNSPLVPGWDCHGLPIELNVEKKIGKAGVKVSPEKFREACREYANNFINIQREEFKRLGIMADWAHPYTTMNYQYEADTIRSLAKIIKKGHLVKGYKPVYWCLECASALAEAEVEYADKASPAIDVRFRFIDSPLSVMNAENGTDLPLPLWERSTSHAFNGTAGEGKSKIPSNLSIPIWTTTPWTLPANQAVAVNANLDYVLVQTDKEYLVLAEPLVETVLKRIGVEDYKILGKTKGKNLENLKVQHPFYNRQVPIILGDHVTTETGTGAVHTAPAHGQDDYVVGRHYNLPVDNPVGDDGCFNASVELFAGEHVNKVNDHIIEVLREHGNLLHAEKLTHSYPHCWRHKTPLIFRSTPQWFVSMDQENLRQDALAQIKKTQWIPEWGEERIYKMVADRPDWCISRQRTWGTPITLFTHKETDQIHPDTVNLIEKIALRVEKEGVEAWYKLDPKELLGDEANQYKKVTDILDVWFDSGVSHECVLRKRAELKFPADIYLEGSDQHRGWFQSSLLTSVAINKVAPYKLVLTHGYVVDAKGRKMSKSLGNVIQPEKIIKSLGADILRLWVASMDYRAEINISDEILARNSEMYRRLRNTARFLLGNLTGFDPDQHLVKPDNMLALDRWAVDKARLFQDEICEAYNTYQFHAIYKKIHQFCSIEMGSFYLDIIKDRQYTTATNSLARRSAQTAMYHIIEALVRWLAPITTFTAEEIWQFMPGKRNESVFLNTWYENLFALESTEKMNQAFWDKMILIRSAVNKELENQRNAGKIGSALEADVTLYCSQELKDEIDLLKDELRFVLITSGAQVLLADSNVTDKVATDVPGLWLKVTPLDYAKCERCWHRRKDVGTHKEHPTLCERCIVNIEGPGEVRRFA